MTHNNSSGFSLVELMVAALLGVILSGAAVMILQHSVSVSDMAGQMGEVHQNSRVAFNLIARDLSMAGTGIPQGGIQLPSGKKSYRSKFACDVASCYILNNTYDDDRLYAVTPGNGRGQLINGSQTDVVTMMYRDAESHFDQYSLTHITPSGNQVTFDPRTNPAVSSTSEGLQFGDIMILSNANGCAAGVVTGVNGDKVLFADNDPLGFNQPSAAFGNIASLANSGNPAGTYPPTRAFRINVITYYLNPSPDGLTTQLMRQVNAFTPIPVAESIQDLQFTYDIFTEAAGTATGDLVDAGGAPNQIRKANILLIARSLRPELFSQRFEHLSLRTAVSTRNLSFRDRYE